LLLRVGHASTLVPTYIHSKASFYWLANVFSLCISCTTTERWGWKLIREKVEFMTWHVADCTYDVGIWVLCFGYAVTSVYQSSIDLQFCMYVRSTARHSIHLQFDISANCLEISAVQSPKIREYTVKQIRNHLFNIGITYTYGTSEFIPFIAKLPRGLVWEQWAKQTHPDSSLFTIWHRGEKCCNVKGLQN
jgi:hypothetical protein